MPKIKEIILYLIGHKGKNLRIISFIQDQIRKDFILQIGPIGP